MSKEMREQINKVKNWGQFLNENKTITSKEELLGEKFYHGTILETWKNLEYENYLFIVDDFEFAKMSAVDRADSMVREYNKSFTAIVVEILITNEIIKLNWIEDDDEGAYREFKHWSDSYNKIGSFVIRGKYDINDFKIIYKETFK
tara:strand:+ start:337 stop:774 length:438 start_codon:yes stop_codon:yes gene_type:complete